MKTIESSNDLKECFLEIKTHIEANKETVQGKKEADILLVISREAYCARSANLSYNNKIEFNFQCSSNSKTQLFEVQ